MVRLDEVEKFCAKLGGRVGRYFRLPKPKTGFSGLIAFEWFFKDRHYWVVVTREFFHTFSIRFPKEPKGFGISQELALLRFAVNDDAGSIILNVGDDMKMYCFGASDWLNYGKTHGTISDYDGEAYGLVSIPVKLLKRWFPDEPPKMKARFVKAEETRRQLEVGLDDFIRR